MIFRSIIIILVILSVQNYGQSISITDTTNGKPMLLGQCTVQNFQDSTYHTWWNEGYSSYKPDSITCRILESLIPGIKIQIIMATWCSDSQEQIPRLFKILKQVRLQPENVSIICVNRNKTAPGIDLKDLKIQLVPTIIIQRAGSEIGRIIETPSETLEKDLLKILNSPR
ncbi:MAG: thioredoxin family protein [Ignavibacteria bacterium]|nr:thioredoxin family protein [Ignavibacteria bacterium]